MGNETKTKDKLPKIPFQHAVSTMRMVMGLIFITHGFARFYYASLTDFGGFLGNQGIPFGWLVAWGITIGELVGGFFLLVRYRVKMAVMFHFLVILAGVFMVHLPNGWFVVGHGSGGMEYSVLILAVLGVLYACEG
ncbi:DoxX family protein [Pararhodonellum marinum]|uniref:DoxX family protein n=1 Tax=Pararhodonellum marinum TaxID=2755358 RepID=UPI00188E76BA|nr:DoxX family protein [Pararhodonellum marinum]